MRKKYINLQHFADDAQIIDRTGAESLIPVEESKEIIQGVVTSSAVLSRGRNLQLCFLKKKNNLEFLMLFAELSGVCTKESDAFSILSPVFKFKTENFLLLSANSLI